MTYQPKKLGILGGGQLGRMTALAAARLGIQCHIYSPGKNSPGGQVVSREFNAPYDKKSALKKFAQSVDAVTYEFENIPLDTISYIQKFCPVYPDHNLLKIAQDRVKEKTFLNDIGISTAGWAALEKSSQIKKEAGTLTGEEFVLKTSRFGYDGKGQSWYVPEKDDAAALWDKLGADTLILEEKIDFSCEISVVIARDKLGQTALYGPMLNEHKNHILYKTYSKAPIPDQMAEQARKMAQLLAEAVDLVGVLALEMFVCKDGRILANEIAPRPHNSGHWTIDGCAVSQFEQHARTTCGLPIGYPGEKLPSLMINLLGDDVKSLDKYFEGKNSCVHIYGKDNIRPGRKMGHVTFVNYKREDKTITRISPDRINRRAKEQ